MKVGFIGLGNVGSKLAGSLLRNGVDVTIRDLDEAKVAEFAARGAKVGESPAQMLRDCDAVITCLPHPSISARVVEGPDGLLEAMGPGKIWMEMSTTDEAEVKRLGAMVVAKGGAVVDCPVSGGCHRADTGNISIFAGCDRETFDRIVPFPIKPPSEHAPDRGIPESLDWVVMKATAKKPDERFDSMLDLIDHLRLARLDLLKAADASSLVAIREQVAEPRSGSSG